MPFLKDDKEAAQHMGGLVRHFSSGKTADALPYDSEFDSLEEVRDSTIEALEELSQAVPRQLQRNSQLGVKSSLSEASQHVQVLDEVVLAKAEASRKSLS